MPQRRRTGRIGDREYARLLSVRTGLRRFDRWSAGEAEARGLTSAQHQLLLAVRGHDPASAATVRDVADHLLIKHHSAVELVDRTERGGWVRRTRDPEDHRVVRLELTPTGQAVLDELSSVHLAELARLRQLFEDLLGELEDE